MVDILRDNVVYWKTKRKINDDLRWIYLRLCEKKQKEREGVFLNKNTFFET